MNVGRREGGREGEREGERGNGREGERERGREGERERERGEAVSSLNPKPLAPKPSGWPSKLERLVLQGRHPGPLCYNISEYEFFFSSSAQYLSMSASLHLVA